MQSFLSAYNNAWKSIVSPFHSRYNLTFFSHGLQKNVQIEQFSIQNLSGKKISAVIIKPKHISKFKHCIFYFHGNGGTKIEALNFCPIVCAEEICVISFDFVGCGNSDPGFLTYGNHQSDDAGIVLKSALKYIEYQKLTIWGRSMGAVTAIVFAQKNIKIVDNLILDSPFRSLKQVVLRIIRQKTRLPSPLGVMLFYFLSKKIGQELQLDIFTFDYLQIYRRISKGIPAFYIYSQNDNFVSKQQIYEFFNSTKGHKDILKIDHEHQQDRCSQVLLQGVKWIKREKNKKPVKLKLFHNQIRAELQRQNVISIF